MSTELNWDKIREDAKHISVERAIRILQSANAQLKHEGKKGNIVDIDYLLEIRKMRQAVLDGNGEKYDTSVSAEEPADGRYPVIDVFHPDKPGCIVAYEDKEGNLIDVVEKYAERSEVLRVRNKKSLSIGDLKQTREDGGSNDNGGTSGDV